MITSKKQYQGQSIELDQALLNVRTMRIDIERQKYEFATKISKDQRRLDAYMSEWDLQNDEYTLADFEKQLVDAKNDFGAIDSSLDFEEVATIVDNIRTLQNQIKQIKSNENRKKQFAQIEAIKRENNRFINLIMSSDNKDRSNEIFENIAINKFEIETIIEVNGL